jgi:hypothetical protein
VATRPVDFRKGAEGLAALVREALGADPFSGTVSVFRAKRPQSRPAQALRHDPQLLFFRPTATTPGLNDIQPRHFRSVFTVSHKDRVLATSATRTRRSSAEGYCPAHDRGVEGSDSRPQTGGRMRSPFGSWFAIRLRCLPQGACRQRANRLHGPARQSLRQRQG